jgi:hypothetical protein
VATAKRCGVVVVADDHEAVVGAQVINPERDRFAHGGVGEVVNVHTERVTLGLVLPALVGQVPDHLFLLGVDADDRLAGVEVQLGLGVDMAELGVAIGMLGALHLLGRRL